jgi:hypothetical protein
MRRTLKRIMLAAVVPTVLALLPALADAQGRPSGGSGGGRPPSGGAPPSSGGHPPSAGARPPAGGGGHPSGPPPSGAHYGGRPYYGGYYGRYYGGYYGYYGYPFWGFGWGWGYPGWYGWGYPYGYPYGGYYDPTPEIRLEVKPREAQVYVDGYFAGVVDDFDGTFQRLRVQPGAHELTLYLKGFRTVTQPIHVGRGQDSKIKFAMEPLAAGENTEPPPQPKSPPPTNADDMDVQPGPPRQAPAPHQQAPRQPVPDAGAVDLGQGFGALVIRVQPSGAEVLIDGERWQGPEGSERLVIQVSEGSHRVEVRKEGFVPFSTTVQVRRGDTAPLNVSLPPRGE